MKGVSARGQALHAEAHYNRPWPAHPPGWSYGSETADIALLFPEFFAKAPHWRILVVSGDADSAVPFMGTMRWINCLKQPVVSRRPPPLRNLLLVGAHCEASLSLPSPSPPSHLRWPTGRIGS